MYSYNFSEKSWTSDSTYSIAWYNSTAILQNNEHKLSVIQKVTHKFLVPHKLLKLPHKVRQTHTHILMEHLLLIRMCALSVDLSMKHLLTLNLKAQSGGSNHNSHIAWLLVLAMHFAQCERGLDCSRCDLIQSHRLLGVADLP